MIRYRPQAVLRRRSLTDPLRLVGVTLDSTFFARSLSEATGTLLLTKGLVALAPLSPVDATDSSDAAALAMADAGVTWSGPHSPAGQADIE
jgi:hypothetical protein